MSEPIKFNVALEVMGADGDFTEEDCRKIAVFLNMAARQADPAMAMNLKCIAFHFMTASDYSN